LGNQDRNIEKPRYKYWETKIEILGNHEKILGNQGGNVKKGRFSDRPFLLILMGLNGGSSVR
jgi:hypothetical protein